MKRMIKYPSISQFRQVIKDLRWTASFIGLDENEQPILDENIIYPTIKVSATEKIHGTNGSICVSEDLFWTESRENIITPEKDNAGFSFWANENKDTILDIVNKLSNFHKIDLKENIIVLSGEWAGDGIQRNTAVVGLKKSFFIFKRFKVASLDSNGVNTWHDTCDENGYIDNIPNKIYNVVNFPTYEFQLDLNNPDILQNELKQTVENIIEPASPLGKQLGFPNNIGEGLVCETTLKGRTFIFKVKGEKHSNSKVKKLKNVDTAIENKKIEIANKVLPAWRLEQALNEVNDTINGGEIDIKNIGAFFKWINKDIIKEESDVINEGGFEPKDIFKYTTVIAKKWYLSELNKF